ncbi:cytochrome P450 [Nonomuraea sp. H19]|uniref:cytochrome P450 n=1 Tax=Nonomuraea sp. H19 TaxID=3452206 RepID=UPI003F8C7D5F
MLGEYAAALERAPLSDETRRTYRSRVRMFLSWLADHAATYSTDPRADRQARDWAVRDYHMWLLRDGPARRSRVYVNSVLTALDDFHVRRGLGKADVGREDLPNSEVVRLDVGDVQMSARKGRLRLYGKGGKFREVDIHPKLRTELQLRLDERPNWPHAGDNRALFLIAKGGRLTARAAGGTIAEIAQTAGLDDPTTAHVLRHTLATTLVRGKTDLVLVAEILGHARLETARRYSLPSDKDNPYAAYQRLCDLGPAAYLTRHDMWFLSRYEQVRAALADWETYSSARGIGLNDGFNQAWATALINLDPPAHSEQRHLFTDRLSPQALRPVTQTIHDRASSLADRLASRGRFDAVADLAQDLPVHVIMDLIGWPEEGRDRLLDMAAGWFDSAGPLSDRTAASVPKVEALIGYLHQVVADEDLTPGGFGWTMLEAYKSGAIPVEAAVGLLAGYVVAAFDTTINLIASGTWLFATNPAQWDLVRADPSLIPGAVTEIVRMESPIQGFSRVTTRDVDLGEGVVIPAGARVLLSYGAANRDERHYPGPDTFDVRRNPVDHLSFSYGIHACAGQGLARLEAQAIFTALASRVQRIELDGRPERALNNITRGFARLPVRIS